jgi:hypothetical protein
LIEAFQTVDGHIVLLQAIICNYSWMSFRVKRVFQLHVMLSPSTKHKDD